MSDGTRTPLHPTADPTALRFARYLAALAAGLIIVGFAGLDRWFFEHVSCRLNTSDRPFDRDFYTSTKLFWITCRYLMAHVVGVVLIFTAVLVRHPARWRHIVAALAAVVLTALLANVLQGAIGRYRPNQADTHVAFAAPLSQLLTKQRVSFPSGEAATAFALATVLSTLLPRWRWWYFSGAALTAIARLVNGAHYPSDVAAGALLGTCMAWVLHRQLLLWSLAPRYVTNRHDVALERITDQGNPDPG